VRLRKIAGNWRKSLELREKRYGMWLIERALLRVVGLLNLLLGFAVVGPASFNCGRETHDSHDTDLSLFGDFPF
jgi:hypothetical protein